MKTLLAKTILAVGGIIALPILIPVFLAALVVNLAYRAVDWVDLYGRWNGDSEARDKARWKADIQ